MKIDPRSVIIPALDNPDLNTATRLVKALGEFVPAFKVHAVSDGPGLAVVGGRLKHNGAKKIWVDFKFADTPDTVTKRAREHRDNGADMITVHADKGPAMVEAAVKNGPKTVIAVTLLSSMTNEEISALYNRPINEIGKVITLLADWALEGGAHALVCSAKQVSVLASTERFRKAFKFIVPGTRSAGVAAHDQKQVDTPYNAILNGADFLVGGRQITETGNPLQALSDMANEIRPAIEQRISAGTWSLAQAHTA